MSYYKCFSINLLRFLKIHGARPISKGVHPVTNRKYWIFEITDEVSDILTTWTKNNEYLNKNNSNCEWRLEQSNNTT